MRNPFRSEADAFRFVIWTIGYFALIVIGAKIDRWLGLAVFVVLSLARRGSGDARSKSRRRRSARRRRRTRKASIASWSSRTRPSAGRAPRASSGTSRGPARTEILVVCPALNTPLRHWVSDEDGARVSAQERLDASLAGMRDAGLVATGEIGDGDPLQAIEDAIRTFRPDALVISTHPAGSLALAGAGDGREGPRAIRRSRSPTSSSTCAPERRRGRPASARRGACRGSPLGARRRRALRRVGQAAAAASTRSRAGSSSSSHARTGGSRASATATRASTASGGRRTSRAR